MKYEPCNFDEEAHLLFARSSRVLTFCRSLLSLAGAFALICLGMKLL